MRGIGKGQTVSFIGLEDVSFKIRENAGAPISRITSKEMIQWVMVNTITATVDGLSEWASQGQYWSTTKVLLVQREPKPNTNALLLGRQCQRRRCWMWT